MTKSASMFETIFGVAGDDSIDDSRPDDGSSLNRAVHDDAAERRKGLLGRFFPSSEPASKGGGGE